MRSDGDSAKDPSQLEREVDEQRREIGDTIHALEEKFSSREVFNQASGYLREHGGDFARSLSNSVKANPLPVALTAVGVLWMMVGQRPSTRMPSYSSDSSEHSSSKMAGLKDKGAQLKGKGSAARERMSAGAHDLRSRAGATGRNLRDKVSGAREGLSHSMEGARGSLGNARGSFEHYLREQPMAVGALGIALGALVGAVLPRTQMEDRTFGDVGEQARSKAADLAEKGYQKAGEMGDSVRREAEDALGSEHKPQHRQTPSGKPTPGPAATP
ncbi:DUF3618 domain-containing protein [Gilvimarinus sp. F26214L]|uniref:DUF3618 domain-containing protein n=1 Tax=Gilvimarinus sp. DZF01 TaxID=3461371 RepID=UPI00404521C0